MIEHQVRPLVESEFRDAHTLFVSALHRLPATDDEWVRSSRRFEQGRVFGAFIDDELAGTTHSFTSSIAVPGGAVVSAAAVSGVGVRADRTRRGVLTSLMRAQLADVRDRSEPVAILHASEALIYGRFGYGPATRARKVVLDPRSASLRPDAPRGGAVRLVDSAAAEKILPDVYQRTGLSRPGMMARNESWWDSRSSSATPGARLVVAVHSDENGVDDGFVVYESAASDYRFGDGSCTLCVIDMHATDSTAAAELWRFVLNVDLVTEVVAVTRPMDEPLEWWLADRRTCSVSSVDDELWVRLVDVEAALNARTFGPADTIDLEVRDAFLPENSGIYRIASTGARRSDSARRPQLSLDVDALGALYLGDVTVSTLVAANRIAVHDPAAVASADRLFTTTEIPWCGTGF